MEENLEGAGDIRERAIRGARDLLGAEVSQQAVFCKNQIGMARRAAIGAAVAVWAKLAGSRLS